MNIQLIQGDITLQRVDVIVNAANSSLLGGGGVDGAIHRAGGISILEECRAIRARQGSLPVGEAVATAAGKLQAQYIIHTVGPKWNNGGNKEATLLRNCYHNSLQLADSLSAKTVAFPNISTGIYGYPKEAAAKIAIGTVRSYESDKLEEVRFICFDAENYDLYAALLSTT